MRKFNPLNAVAIYSSAALVAFLLLRLVLTASYSPDLGGIENNVIYNTAKVLDGGHLYDDPESGNFNITQYSPAYYYFLIGVSKVFNLKPLTDLHLIYILGRALSIIFNLLGGYLIFRLLRNVLKTEASVAIIAVSVYFLNLTRIHFAARPDSLFNLASIFILYCFTAYLIDSNDPKRYRFFALGIICAAFSIFIKQTGIQFLAILPAYFLLTKQFKDFFLSAISLALTTAVFSGIFYTIYGLEFIQNVFGGLNNGISIVRIYDVFSNFFLKFQAIFVLGVYFAYIFFRKQKPNHLRFLSFSIISLFGFAFVTSVKEGSWINYYNEFIVAVIILAATELRNVSTGVNFRESFGKTVQYIFFAYIVLLLPNIIVSKVFHEHFEHLKAPAAVFNQQVEVAKYLNANLEEGKYFLAFDEHINSLLPLKSVVPNKDLVPSQSRFDYTKFDELFANHGVQYVVFPTPKPQSGFMGHDFSSFPVKFSNEYFTILENKAEAAEAQEI